MLSGSEVSVELNGPGSGGNFIRQCEEEREREREGRGEIERVLCPVTNGKTFDRKLMGRSEIWG